MKLMSHSTQGKSMQYMSCRTTQMRKETRLESTPTELMEDAIQVLAKPGAKWDVSPTGIKTLSASSLRPEANLWVYLVKKRLIPTTHDKTVSRDRVMAAYCIMRRINLDVGRIIAA